MDDRIIQGKAGKWFYRARGGQRIGPFASREAAEIALAKQMRIWGVAPTPKATWRGWRAGARLKKLFSNPSTPNKTRRSGS